MGVASRQHRARERPADDAAADRAEQRPLGIVAQAGAVEIGGEVFFEVVVARHCVAPAALLPQPHPEAPVLREDILDRHAERGADAGSPSTTIPPSAPCAVSRSAARIISSPAPTPAVTV